MIAGYKELGLPAQSFGHFTIHMSNNALTWIAKTTLLSEAKQVHPGKEYQGSGAEAGNGNPNVSSLGNSMRSS